MVRLSWHASWCISVEKEIRDVLDTGILIASAFAARASNRVASADPHHDGGRHHGYHDDGWGAGHDAGHGHHGDDHPIYVEPGHHGDHDDGHWVDDDHDHAIDDHWDVHHTHRTSGHHHAAYWSPGAWRWDGAEWVWQPGHWEAWPVQ